MRRKRRQLMTKSGTTEDDTMRDDSETRSTFKDSGSRTEFGTGAVRDAQEGKGRMDLLPVRALIELAKVFEEGSKKYLSHNWRKGIPLSRFFDSGIRHAFKYLRGDTDEPHDAMACWNFMCLIETRMMIEEGLLPESLNDLIFNPLTIDDNPLDIQETHPGGGYIQPKEAKATDLSKAVDTIMTQKGSE